MNQKDVYCKSLWAPTLKQVDCMLCLTLSRLHRCIITRATAHAIGPQPPLKVLPKTAYNAARTVAVPMPCAVPFNKCSYTPAPKPSDVLWRELLHQELVPRDNCCIGEPLRSPTKMAKEQLFSETAAAKFMLPRIADRRSVGIVDAAGPC